MATKTQQWRCNSSNDANTAVKESEAEAEAFPSLKIVGICGAIGSGKSYASSLLTSKINELSDMTAHHIDTDSLAHGVYAPGSKAIDEIGDEFGEHVISNGTVDRKALGSIVFSNNSKMQKLERIVWPHVKALLIQQIKDIHETTKENDTGGIVVVEAAVLLDADWDQNGLFDAIWIVRASEDKSIERLVEKRGMEKEEALKRLKAQFSRRGIGNWQEELDEGVVTDVILNEDSDLWDKMKASFVDPSCWKDNRCPPKPLEVLS